MTDQAASPASNTTAATTTTNTNTAKPAVGAVGNTTAEAKINANAQAEAAAAGEPTYEAVINGKKVQVPVKDLISGYQKVSSADEKFRLAAAKEKQLNDFLEAAKKNGGQGIKSIAKEFGVDLRALIEQEMAEDIKKQLMTPEQRELAEYKAKVAAIEAEKKAQADKAKEERKQAYAMEQAQTIEREIKEALAKTKLPGDKYAIARMAFYMDHARRSNAHITWEQAANQVKADYISDIKELIVGIQEDPQLLEMLGPDAIKKINKALISKAKGVQPNATVKATNQLEENKKPRASKKKLSNLEWREMMENKVKLAE